MNKFQEFSKTCKYGIPLVIYGIIYLTWFAWLEKTVTKHYTVIHMDLDDYIPFCEFFVIPYFLWFLYVAATVVFLLIKDKEGYVKSCTFLFTGMTVFLIVSTLWPNGHHLRPLTMPRENIFSSMVLSLYNTDTATNLWPSIHVYNSLGAHFALTKCEIIKKHKWICNLSFILCWSIILSTVFIKQHSLFDVFTAFLMAAIMYLLVYKMDFVTIFRAKFLQNKSHKSSNTQIG